jgi:hypothetical protein
MFAVRGTIRGRRKGWGQAGGGWRSAAAPGLAPGPTNKTATSGLQARGWCNDVTHVGLGVAVQVLEVAAGHGARHLGVGGGARGGCRILEATPAR